MTQFSSIQAKTTEITRVFTQNRFKNTSIVFGYRNPHNNSQVLGLAVKNADFSRAEKMMGWIEREFGTEINAEFANDSLVYYFPELVIGK